MIEELAGAYSRGELRAVERLLAAGVDPNKPTAEGITPLYYAAAWGHADVIHVLLAAGADVNHRNAELYSPLMAAAHVPNRAGLVALVEAGADVNATDLDGQTALAIACERGVADTVLYLLESGADVNARFGELRTTPLIHAVFNDRAGSNIIETLLGEGADPTLADALGRTQREHATTRNPAYAARLSHTDNLPQ